MGAVKHKVHRRAKEDTYRSESLPGDEKTSAYLGWRYFRLKDGHLFEALGQHYHMEYA